MKRIKIYSTIIMLFVFGTYSFSFAQFGQTDVTVGSGWDTKVTPQGGKSFTPFDTVDDVINKLMNDISKIKNLPNTGEEDLPPEKLVSSPYKELGQPGDSAKPEEGGQEQGEPEEKTCACDGKVFANNCKDIGKKVKIEVDSMVSGGGKVTIIADPDKVSGAGQGKRYTTQEKTVPEAPEYAGKYLGKKCKYVPFLKKWYVTKGEKPKGKPVNYKGTAPLKFS